MQLDRYPDFYQSLYGRPAKQVAPTSHPHRAVMKIVVQIDISFIGIGAQWSVTIRGQ